jgi:broad specificity phosphatase PhoE
MPRLYLVRHGRAEAGFGEAADPGLDALGHAQAQEAALRLAPLGPLALRTSPLRRTRETAAPLEAVWKCMAAVDFQVAEIPSPTADLAERAAWLRAFMAGSWRDADFSLAQWREDLIANLLAIEEDTVIFSHFVAINVAAGAALGDDRVVVFRPENCSVTVLDVAASGLVLVEKGREGAWTKVN